MAAADSPPWLPDVPGPAAPCGVLKVLAAASPMAPSSPGVNLDSFWATARRPALFPARAPRKAPAHSTCRETGQSGSWGAPCSQPCWPWALVAQPSQGEERRAKSSSRCSLDSLLPAGPFQLSRSLTPRQVPCWQLGRVRPGSGAGSCSALISGQGGAGRALGHPPAANAAAKGRARSPRGGGQGEALVPRWGLRQPGARGGPARDA